jgi:hypothetical protein
MNKIKQLLLGSILLSFSGLLLAWVEPVDMNADNGDELTTDTRSINGVDRCDTLISTYQEPPSKQCHRWGLVWELQTLLEAKDWEPGKVVEGYRLPTIKELIKLFDYTGGTGFGSYESELLTLMSNHLKGAKADNVWLVSSSYRDIDGKYDVYNNNLLNPNNASTGRLQVFAINTVTGEVKTFEPGSKGSDNKLQLCTSLLSDGDCVLDSTHSLYQLLVSQKLLKDWTGTP